jgi:hypothetical protein
MKKQDNNICEKFIMLQYLKTAKDINADIMAEKNSKVYF